jgi:hypothetical protein
MSSDDNSFRKFAQLSPIRTTGKTSKGGLGGIRKLVKDQLKHKASFYPPATHIDPAIAFDQIGGHNKSDFWKGNTVYGIRGGEDSEFSAEAGYSERDENPFEDDEERLRDLQRLDQMRQRELLAIDLLDKAKANKEKLTPALNKAKYLMEEPKTNDDLARRVSADFNLGLMHKSVVPPRKHRLRTLLRTPPGTSKPKCYGCEIGLNAAGVGTPLVLQMRSAIVGIWAQTKNDFERARLISRHWEISVKRPANKNLTQGEAMIGSWIPASVQEHFADHVTEPSFKIEKFRNDWEELYDLIHNGSVLFVTAQQARTGQIPNEDDIRIASEGMSQLKVATEMCCKLMALDPKKMPGYQAEFNVTKALMGPIANQITYAVEDTDVNPVFGDREDWKL